MITESVNLPPADVEVIVLQTVDIFDATVRASKPAPKTPKRQFRIEAFED
ncbi:hypothetical protein [Nodularia sphaerocarpa]|nr:hypothetical protein [Nodularia sphaerocarpa]MDB9371828.1 hypothetical protein [Nodularia sphaerocarpa CS-585]MDB9376473.1 hypothetical protein [Nodularia sphaerocarpa CS-585A2]